MKDRPKNEQGDKSPGDPRRPKDAVENPMQPSPALIEFAKAPVIDESDEELWPLPEELLRNRREWAKTIKENTGPASDLHGDKNPNSKPTPDRDPPQR